MPVEQDRTRPDNILIYDEECFLCSNYVRLLNLKAAIGDIVLINARDKQALGAFHFSPVNLNEGILLILGDKQYFGADAIHHLALLSTSSGVFNRLNRLIFRSRFAATVLYPFLKLGRRIYLLLAGKDIIR